MRAVMMVIQQCYWAQQNTFEALPGFIGAVIIAHLAGGAQDSIDTLSVGYIILRLCYGFAYIFDMPTIRSVLWLASVGCIIGLFVISA